MSKYQKGMTIILDDNNEYIILKTNVINDIQYAYVQNINDSEDDAFVSIINDYIQVVKDPQLINYLFENM